MLRECLSIREKAPKQDDWRIEEGRRLLGECLTAQGADRSLTVAVRIEKLREAEALLLELANAMLDDDTSYEDRKTEAIQRVVNLYEARHAAEPDAGYDAKAAECHRSLENQPVKIESKPASVC